MIPWSWNKGNSRRKPSNKKNKSWGKAKDHFSFLSGLADDTHQVLSRDDSPLRFCVYKQKNDVLIDVIALNQEPGKQARTRQFRRTITHEKAENIIKNIHTRQGLVLDYRV